MLNSRSRRSMTAALTVVLALWTLAGTDGLRAQEGPATGDEADRALVGTVTPVAARARSGAGAWVVRPLLLGALINGESDALLLDTGDDIAVGADVTYFMSDRLALNLLAAFVNPEVSSDAEAVEGSLGSVKAVPPTLTLQYHLAPQEKVRPYIGAGVNYTNFFDVTGALDAEDVEIEDALGVAGQAGLNIMLSDVVSFGADFRWVFILNDPEVTTATLGTDELELDWPIIAVGFGFHP